MPICVLKRRLVEIVIDQLLKVYALTSCEKHISINTYAIEIPQ